MPGSMARTSASTWALRRSSSRSIRATIHTRADEGDEEFADGGHAGVGKEEGSDSLLIGWPEWLGEASNIVALRPPGGPRPGADQEVVAALDEPQADADRHQRDEHGGYALVYRRPGDLVQTQGGKRDPETDTASSLNTARSVGSEVTLDSSRNSRW